MSSPECDAPTARPAARLSRRRLIATSAAIAPVLVTGRPAFARKGATPAATPGATPDANEVAGLVDVGGRSVYREDRGSGGPTVVLEAGYRSPLDVWTTDLISPEAPRTMVRDGVAAFTRTVVYDRPGVAAIIDGVFIPSRSEPVPMPRTAADAVSDLYALLTAAAVPGPYVLVGHSFGGLVVRLFASTYPDDVVGMVLVDALSESVRTGLTADEWAAYERVVSAVPPDLAAYVDLETMDVDASFDQMTAASGRTPLAGIPLTVIPAGLPFGIPEADLTFSPDRLQDAWAQSQGQLAALTGDARHVVATESAHYVQLQQPDLVIEAIRQVVEAVRDPATWSTGRAMTAPWGEPP